MREDVPIADTILSPGRLVVGHDRFKRRNGKVALSGHPPRALRDSETNQCTAVPLETELYSSLVPEVALVIVALREVIAKASQ